jgi:hypothetical protein
MGSGRYSILLAYLDEILPSATQIQSRSPATPVAEERYL